MPDEIEVRVNDKSVLVPPGATVAAAIALAGLAAFRRSVDGEPRGPLCGMGICFECRATIDGDANRRTCQTPCRAGMRIETDV